MVAVSGKRLRWRGRLEPGRGKLYNPAVTALHSG
jgi:hypothetical protein